MLRGDDPNSPAAGYKEGGGIEPLVDRRVRNRHRLAGVVRPQRAVDAAGDISRRTAHDDRLRPSRVGAEVRAHPPAASDPGPRAAVLQPPLVAAERKAIVRVQRDAVALLEAGPGPLGVDVLIVLRDVPRAAAATAEGRRVVARPGEGVFELVSQSARLVLSEIDGRRIENRTALRRRPGERLDALDAQPVGIAVRRTHDLEVRADRVPILRGDLIRAKQRTLHADHRLVGGADDVVAVDAVVVAGLVDVDAGEGALHQQRPAQPADVRAGGRKRRLLREPPRDPGVRVVVVLNLPAASELELRWTAPCRREPRRDVVGVLLDQRSRERPAERPCFAGLHRRCGREIRSDIEVDETAVLLDERISEIPAHAQVERQVAAGPPLVLKEEPKVPPGQGRLARAVGDRRLLRHPEEEIGEVEPGQSAERAAIGGVDPGEHERAVGVALVVGRRLVVVEHAARLDLMPAERPAPVDVGADAIADRTGRVHVAQPGDARKAQSRQPPGKRAVGHALDPDGVGDVGDAAEVVDRSRRRMVVVGRQAELVASALNVELVRKAVVAGFAGAAQRAEHVQLIVVRLLILEVQVHVDVGARAGRAPPRARRDPRSPCPPARPRCPAAAAPAAGAGLLPGEAVLEMQLHLVLTGIGRRRAVIVARRARQRRRGVVLQQRQRLRADTVGRNLVARERLAGQRVDEGRADRGEVAAAHGVGRHRRVLIERGRAGAAGVRDRAASSGCSVLVDAGDLERDLRREVVVVIRVLRFDTANLRTQLLGRAIQRGPAERVVGGPLNPLPAAEVRVAAASTTWRRHLAHPDRLGPGRWDCRRRVHLAPGSWRRLESAKPPVAGIEVGRQEFAAGEASRRSFSTPRSTRAASPVTANASARASEPKPAAIRRRGIASADSKRL